jgi:hypothetical protein
VERPRELPLITGEATPRRVRVKCVLEDCSKKDHCPSSHRKKVRYNSVCRPLSPHTHFAKIVQIPATFGLWSQMSKRLAFIWPISSSLYRTTRNAPNPTYALTSHDQVPPSAASRRTVSKNPRRMSAFGTKQAFQSRSAMSAFGGRADVNGRQTDVCF